MKDVVVGIVRADIGKFSGSLAEIPAPDLGAHAINGLLEHTGVKPARTSEALMGQVLTAAAVQTPARQAAIKAGPPDRVPGMTISKVCGSGLKATRPAAQAIRHDRDATRGLASLRIGGMGVALAVDR